MTKKCRWRRPSGRQGDPTEPRGAWIDGTRKGVRGNPKMCQKDPKGAQRQPKLAWKVWNNMDGMSILCLNGLTFAARAPFLKQTLKAYMKNDRFCVFDPRGEVHTWVLSFWENDSSRPVWMLRRGREIDPIQNAKKIQFYSWLSSNYKFTLVLTALNIYLLLWHIC